MPTGYNVIRMFEQVHAIGFIGEDGKYYEMIVPFDGPTKWFKSS